jgi:hypothetical protein
MQVVAQEHQEFGVRVESKKGPKRKKTQKMCFASWKAYFSYCYFFITPFPLHFKHDF